MRYYFVQVIYLLFSFFACSATLFFPVHAMDKKSYASGKGKPSHKPPAAAAGKRGSKLAKKGLLVRMRESFKRYFFAGWGSSSPDVVDLNSESGDDGIQEMSPDERFCNAFTYWRRYGSCHPPRGARNIGNTCYQNSLIQALMSLGGMRHPEADDSALHSEARRRGLQVALRQMRDAACQLRPASFTRGAQADPMEFLSLIFDVSQQASALCSLGFTDAYFARDAAGGMAFRRSVPQVPGSIWPLSMANARAGMALPELIRNCLSREELEVPTVDGCTSKRVYLTNFPRSLAITLSRYVPAVVEGHFQVLRDATPVRIPSNLDFSADPLRECVVVGTRTARYALKALVVQQGGEDARSGHYVAYVRRPQGWLKCNDERITFLGAGLPRVVTDGIEEDACGGGVPYIVFYDEVPK